MVPPIKPKAEGSSRVLRLELTPKSILTMVLILAGVWILLKLMPVFLVLIAAYFIVGTLNPAVRWLEGKKVERGLAIGITFGSLTLLLVLGVILTVPALLAQSTRIMDQEPVLRAQLADQLSEYPISLPLSKWLRHFKYSGSVNQAGASAFAYSMQALEFLAYALSTFFLALYIMIDRNRLRGGFFAIVPRTHHIRLSRILANLEVIVGAYIRGQLITSSAVGIFILILLIACGVENALALSVFSAIADILPYIGIFLPIGLAVLSSLPNGPVVTIVILSLMILYMEFESRVLVPRVYGQALRLPSSVVLFSLLVGGTLLGITGALLALPFAAAVMMLLEELRVQLPGERPANDILRAKDDLGEEEYERRTEGVSAEESAAIAVEISGDRVKEENEVLKKAAE